MSRSLHPPDVVDLNAYEQKVVKTRYWLDENLRGGIRSTTLGIEIPCKAISYKKCNHEVEVNEALYLGHCLAYSYNHPNLLRVFLLDEDKKLTLFEEYSKTLEEYLMELGDPFIEFTVGATSKSDEIHGFYMIEECKKLIRDAVALIQFLHGDNVFLGSFDEKNLVVNEGKLKFFNLHLVRLERGHCIGIDRQYEDYKNLSSVIRRVFIRGNDERCPADLKHFINLVENREEWHARCQAEDLEPYLYLIANHVSVMKAAKKYSFYYRFYECIWRFKGTAREQIYRKQVVGFTAAKESKWSRWAQNIKDGCVLSDILTFENACYDDTTDVNLGMELIRLFWNATTNQHLDIKLRDLDVIFPGFVAEFQLAMTYQEKEWDRSLLQEIIEG